MLNRSVKWFEAHTHLHIFSHQKTHKKFRACLKVSVKTIVSIEIKRKEWETINIFFFTFAMAYNTKNRRKKKRFLIKMIVNICRVLDCVVHLEKKWKSHKCISYWTRASQRFHFKYCRRGDRGAKWTASHKRDRKEKRHIGQNDLTMDTEFWKLKLKWHVFYTRLISLLWTNTS